MSPRALIIVGSCALLLMLLALCQRLDRLNNEIQAMPRLAPEAASLQRSVEDLDRAVVDLKARLDEQAAARAAAARDGGAR